MHVHANSAGQGVQRLKRGHFRRRSTGDKIDQRAARRGGDKNQRANLRLLGNPTIRWRGHECLFRVDIVGKLDQSSSEGAKWRLPNVLFICK
jgi:hypothetical protein